MKNTKDRVHLDEVLKFLFSTSNKVLLNLLNAIFDEDFKEDEAIVTVGNNEFIQDTFDVIRGDLFFKITDENNISKKANYHIELQTKNDNSMVIRTFEYGFNKGKEESKIIKGENIRNLYFPKQKVIFFEQNNNINNVLNLNIIFPNNKEFLYCVDVIKYWEYTEEELIKKKMYPLLPLQLFLLRKDLELATKKGDINLLKELSFKAKNLAQNILKESKELFDSNEIYGEDFHKMLLGVQNLIEYLNRNYIDDEKLEEEVINMTKSLYDPEVEKIGIEKGRQEGQKEKALEIAKSLLDVLDIPTICEKTGLSIEEIKKLMI